MYHIEKRIWGYKLSFGGYISRAEMERWAAESQAALSNQSESFGVYVDMRDLKPLASDVQDVMIRGQMVYKDAGMERSVVVVESPTTAMQFKRLARASGIYDWERYVSSSSAGWEEVAMDWIRNAMDPDLVPVG